MNRVVITGLGAVSSIGIGVEEFDAGIRAGRPGISRIESFDPSGFPFVHAGEVRGFEPERILRRLEPGAWGRSSLFAAAAARLAVTDARLDPAGLERAGTVIGTTSGESQVIEKLTAQLVASGFGGLSAELTQQLPAARLAQAVTAELAMEGPATTMCTACSASNYAIGYAYDLLAEDEADVMIAGGADSVCRWAHAGFYRLGALTETACAPFDRDRSGILTGEGGVALVLETLDHARARGAHPYAEVLGYGLNCDAYHMVAPNAESIAACMRLAHRNAGVEPSDIDFISAHGTGTPANDAVEARAVFEVFGDEPPPISSIKSMLGHTMGAASGFGAAATALAIDRGVLPPTINWSAPEAEFARLDVVANRARPARVRVAQNNGFAFGGNNAIVIFGEAP